MFRSTRPSVAALCAVFVAALSTLPVSGQSFEEVSGAIGVDLSHVLAPICDPPIGSGSAWADYDGDGDLDFFTTNHGADNRLYRNDGDLNFDGLPDYTDVAPELGLSDPAGVGLGAVFIDYDNDGDQDLYVTSWGGNTLYQNQLADSGLVGFLDATFFAGVEDYGRGITASWADFDGDGHLDLYIAKHMTCNTGFSDSRDSLFRNLGNGTFDEVTDWMCIPGACPPLQLGLGFSPGWFDYDADGDLDLYLANDDIGHDGTNHPNVLWRNDGPDKLGDWTFTDVSAESGTDISANAMGLGIGDFDNDLDFDLAFSNVGRSFLLQNSADGTFVEVAEAAGVDRPLTPGDEFQAITWATAFFDYDNDMDLDLLFVGGYIGDDQTEIQPNALFSNNGDGTFTDVSVESGLDDDGRGRSASITDLDGDGFLDVLIGNFGQEMLLMRNSLADQGNTNHWIAFEVEGTTSNRDGVGTLFVAETPDGVTQMRQITTGPTHGGGDFRVAHFGIGQNTSADITVTWPTGEVQQIGNVTADQYLFLREGFSINELGPGIAGQANTLRISGGTPGQPIGIFSADGLGQTVLQDCPGAVLGLDNPVSRQIAPADENGNLLMTFTPPADLAGTKVYMQAMIEDGCSVSNVFSVTLE